ncbi:alpha/beta fold hydrolase [Neolewinella antarctica]|uniref:Pimeloyl-ACP methyl ester carboxylesterase n=1 Tax=Neolewinella antarctica TaxID=442734 RepID=A0ABX0X7T6_9BACT|nr:alpha/beta hydrolase [Neolewinella antarctica]NJC25270.1 pimeloyl-ACP methyl ester carboxylesterase [Neolewinella antarctica]
MPFFTNDKSPNPADIHYEDYGSGKPVILIHGWPLSLRAWEPQIPALVEAGHRVISYSRRGFGVSSAPWSGYDYTTLASDLRALILKLDLQDVTLVGFSMGGGEVVRYFTEYGADRISKAALISSIIPLVLKKDDNPDGVPQSELDGIMTALKTDRVGFLKTFVKNFYNYKLLNHDVSEGQLEYDWSIAAYASPRATLETAKSWGTTDFRSECKNVTVPTLIVHGTSDNIVPKATAGDQAAELIPNNTYKTIDGAPHGLNVTHKDELNKILIDFLG